MRAIYNLRAARRPVNLSLNEDLVAKVRETTPNLSERVEALLVADLAAEYARRADADAAMARAVAAWNAFGEEVGSFADEHSTL
jgi:antitoxin CcdA